jgi:hypothetical protein
MIGTVRKHQGWLWAIIITVTIISFLYWSPNVSRNQGGAGGDYDFGSINGKKITRDEYQKAAEEIGIIAFFSSREGRWPDQSELSSPQGVREIYNRLALFEKMRELNVRPTKEATVQWIKNFLNRGSNVEVSFEQFERFVKNTFEPHGVTLEKFEEFSRHELGREHLQSVYGMTGALVTPAEGTELYRIENDDTHAEVAVFSSSNYLSQVKVTDEELGKFYTNYASQYDLPPRVQVNYVKFDIKNYYAEADKEMLKATNINTYLDQQYYARTNEFAGMSRDDAMKKLKEDVRKQFALTSARKEAADFIQELYKGHDDTHPLTPEDISKAAAAKNLQVKQSPLFDRNATTNEVGLPAQALQAASRLSNNNPDDPGREQLYTITPIVAEDGAYVLGLKQKVDSTSQPFSTVKSKVTQDYKRVESAKLARDAGNTFAKYATNQVAQGKKFSAIADEKKVKLTKLPPFALSTPSIPGLNESIDPRQLKVVASKLSPGKASDFIGTQDGGFVLFVDSRSPADPVKMQAELPKFMDQIREQRQYAAFSEWFQKQVADMRLVAPALQEKTPPAQGQPAQPKS